MRSRAFAGDAAKREFSERGLAIVLTSRTAVGGLQVRFAALADHLIHREGESGCLIAHQSVVRELRRVGYILEDNHVVTIPEKALYRSRVATGMWILIHVVRRKYRHVHLASNPSPLSWLFATLRAVTPRFSVSAVNSRVGHSQRWIRALRHAESVDCLSPSIAGKLVERDPELAHRVRVAPCSFPARPTGSVGVECSGPETRDIDLLFVSRFVRGKGIELLNALGPEFADLNVRIAGTGPYRPHLPGATVGPEKDVRNLYRRSKVFLSLQLETNYPSQVIYEAVHFGCALVVVDTGDTRRFLNEECAALVPPKPDAIASAVRHLLANPSKMHDMTEKASQSLLSHTVDAFAQYFFNEVVKP